MAETLFDLAIIGAGVTGSSIAYQLSAYDTKVVVLEKMEDISFGVTKANSGIIHAGFHHKPDSLKAHLEIQGNLMYDELKQTLDFPFKRVGILVAAFNYEEMKMVEKLYHQGVENNVPRIEIVSRERILDLEPKLSQDVVGGLYAPTGGIIEPYRFVFALMESALKNGVELRRNFMVSQCKQKDGVFTILSADNQAVRARRVVNAAGLYSDEVSRIFKAEEFQIIPRKGEEYLLERNASGFPRHVIFPVPVKNSKGVLVIPTVEGTMMIGPTAEEIDDKEDFSTTRDNLERVFTLAMKMVPMISKKEIITSFAGLRPAMKGNDFLIKISDKTPHFIQAAAIQSPGLTAAPAIGLYVLDLLKQDGMELVKKIDHDPKLEKKPMIREFDFSDADKLISDDRRYGNIVCRCENVSEAEIIEAIKNGHHTLDGIKFYTRAGMGRCQGGFCAYKIIKILMRETGKSAYQLTKRGGNSFLLSHQLGEGKVDTPS
ncbi:MAG: FAD-dependent oxidoreductase [Spirochaetales bacterium]|nr:FAD-dependent oxidoreductase [Spirochaetales bacterium]